MKKLPEPLFFCENPVLSNRIEKIFETYQSNVTFVPNTIKKEVVELTKERLKQKLKRMNLVDLENEQRFYPNINLTFNRNDFGYGGRWSIFVEKINDDLHIYYVNSDRTHFLIFLDRL